MKLNQFENIKNKVYSIELCSEKELHFDSLSKLNPLYYSVTWHTNVNIDNNDKEKNCPAFIMASKLQTKNILLHLPCRYYNQTTILNVLKTAKDLGIENIFALYGETNKSKTNTIDFGHAIDLVKFIREQFGTNFSICVAGYPSCHPRAISPEQDLIYLKQKVDAGADFIITQAVFNIEVFHEFYAKCRAIGINVPIIPGIYIIKTYGSLIGMANLCKIIIPESILNSLELIKNYDEEVYNFGIAHAMDLIESLLNNEKYPVKNVHIFSLNDTEHVEKVCENISYFK